MSQNGTINPILGSQYTDQALFTNILINSVLAVLFFVLYLLSKYCRPKLYQLSDVQPPTQWLGWIKMVFLSPLNPIIDTHGMDVFAYLHFLRMCFHIIIALSFFGLIVMMPINATGTNKYITGPGNVSGTPILSLSNIASDDNLRLGFHVVAVLYNSFVCCLFLYFYFREFVKIRVKIKCLNKVENYTVCITGYNSNKWKQERLFKFFSKLFPERIYCMHVVPDIPKLDALHERRFKLVLAKEAEVVKKRKEKGPDHCSKSVELLDKKIKKIDKILQNLVNQPSDWNVYPPSEQLQDKLPRMEKMNVLIQKKVEGTKMAHTPKRVKKALKVCDNQCMALSSPSITNTTYVTFQSKADFHLCSRIITESTPRWQIFPASDPKEIFWKNHTPNVGSWKRLFLRLFGATLCFFMILFFIIPVTFATGLSNLSTIASLPGLSSLNNLSAAVKSVIEGFLPQLVILIFFILLVPLIASIVKKTFLPLNRTEKSRSAIIVYFTFQIVNIYCAGLVTTSFWSIVDQLENIVEEPLMLPNLLGVAVPAQATFFINYVTVTALRGSMLALWKPWALVFEGFGLCCSATPRDYQELYRPEQFIFRQSFAERMFILIVVLCYSNIAPLMLPFGFLYFFFMFLTETYRLLYVCRQKSLGGGLMWCTMFNLGCFGVGVYGVTMLGVFVLKKFVAGVVISVLVVVGVIMFASYMNRRWFPIAYYGSYDSMLKHKKKIPTSDYQNLFVHPSLLPVPPEKQEFYGDLETMEVPPNNKKPPSIDNTNLSVMNGENSSESITSLKSDYEIYEDF